MPEIPREYLEWEPPPGYRTQDLDTSPQIEHFLFDSRARQAIWQRAEQLRNLNKMVSTLEVASILRLHPGADDREVARRVAVRRFDAATVKAAFGFDPEAPEMR